MDNIQWIRGNKKNILHELNNIDQSKYDIFINTILFCKECDGITKLPKDRVVNHKNHCNRIKDHSIIHDHQWIESNKKSLVQFWNDLLDDFEIHIHCMCICRECGKSKNFFDEKIIHDTTCSHDRLT